MIEIPAWFVVAAFTAFGLVFGSFGNVVIWRVPRGESIVSPPSHCTRCGRDVRWYDNVPLLSWVLLRGRCRDCGEPISVRYPLVEGASGALWGLAGWHWGLTFAGLAAALFFYLAFLLAMIDLDTGRLPNPVVATMAGVGAAAAALSQLTGVPAGPLVSTGSGWLAQPAVYALAGAGAGLAVSWTIATIYEALRGHAGLGMGDVKLLAAMGLFLGPWVLLAYVLGTLLGLVGGIASIVRHRGGGEDDGPRMLRFGPYLAAGAIITALAGPAIWMGYLESFTHLARRLFG